MDKPIHIGDINSAALRHLLGNRCLRAAGLGVFDSVGQTATVTLSGTFDVGDVWTVTLGGVAYTYTALATDVNLDGVATALAAVIDAADAYTASADGAVITIVAADTTVPYTITASTTNDAAGTDNQAIAVAVTSTQVSTATVGGTFEVDCEFVLTLGGVPFTHTVVGGDVNNDGVATAIAALVDAHADYTAAAVGAVVTITKAEAGQFSITSSVTTAVGGADDQTLAVATTSTQISTATLSGAFDVNDVYTVTLGGVALSYTVLAGATNIDGVATALAAVIDANADYNAAAVGAVITITKVAAGYATITATATNDAAGTADQALAVANTVNSVKEAETDNAIVYTIDGKAYGKAAATAIVVTGGVLSISAYRWYIVQADAAAALTTKAGEDNANWLPKPDANKTIIGAFKVATDATHTFTPATTALNATGITTTFFDLSCVPKAGYPT